MTRILLFARDPGGANALIPLMQPLQPLAEAGFSVLLWGKDTALDLFAKADLAAENFADFADAGTPENVRRLLEHLRPDILLTGTSADDMTEKYLWQAAADLNIPSAAILDNWVNYGVRFSPYGVSEIEAYRQQPEHPYLPDRILVMDELARKEMVAEGLPPERIIVTGNPYFDRVREAFRHISEKDCQALRQQWGVSPKAKLVLFASQPLRQLYGSDTRFYGYDEATTLSALVKASTHLQTETDLPLHLVVKPHPKEDIAGLEALLAERDTATLPVTVDKTACDPWLAIAASDVVTGMSTMLLCESLLAGKPTLSIQIGLNNIKNQPDPLVLTRKGYLPRIESEAKLIETLQQSLSNGNQPVSKSTTSLFGTEAAVPKVLAALQALKAPSDSPCLKP